MSEIKFPAIPQPSTDVQALLKSVLALKEAVEILTGQLGGGAAKAITLQNLSQSTVVDSINDIVNSEADVDDAIEQLHETITLELEAARTELEDAQAQAIAEVEAALTAEAGTRLSADEAITVTVTSQGVSISNNAAAITTESVTRATADSALGARIDTVEATAATNAAAITSEAVTRASEDAALATQITSVSAVASRQRIFVQSTPPDPLQVGEDALWMDTLRGNVVNVWDGEKWVDAPDERISINTASITHEQTVRAEADDALAQDILTVSAAVDTANASITQEALTRAQEDSAIAVQTATVSARAEQYGASGFYRLAAVADPHELTAAEFAVEVTAGVSPINQMQFESDYAPAGFYLVALKDGTRRAVFAVDQFYIRNGTSDGVPFRVSGGNTYIQTALIEDASIVNAKIANATIETAKIADAAINNAKIADGSITTAKIDNAQITNAKIVDATIEGAKIANLAVDTLQIAGNAVTVPIIQTLSSTISGPGTFSEVSVVSTTITAPAGSTVTLFATWTCRPSYTGAVTNNTYVLYINGSDVAVAAGTTTDYSLTLTGAISFVATGSPQTISAHVNVILGGSAGQSEILGRTIYLAAVKR